MDTKALTAPLRLKDDGADDGQLVARFAVYNTLDSQGDVIRPGAIRSGQIVPMVPAHDWRSYAIGEGVTEERADGAYYLAQLFTDIPLAADWYRSMKHRGPRQEWSFGFRVTEAESGEFEGQPVRIVKGLELFEVSPVLVGANRGTATLSLKGDDGDEELFGLDPCPACGHDRAFDEGNALELRAEWTAAFVNDLPDSAFAVIEAGGSRDADGKTVPRRLRHFPHHNAQGAPDAPHVRNALARIPQSSLSAALKARAEGHVRRHADRMSIGTSSLREAMTSGLAFAAWHRHDIEPEPEPTPAPEPEPEPRLAGQALYLDYQHTLARRHLSEAL